ncbi:sensor histidine kinase [Paenibacillus sp.]|uniref:cache domain-containing sensor histidine kinase n=1 Tax=Paenibacillus sp. TaxID=58172 RepID=UPI002D44A6E2|nr:sensor histidine kinase [Paenibacillus sp.]HZG85938.1 sensor histidine kinase [Paenibacillus sp.]
MNRQFLTNIIRKALLRDKPLMTKLTAYSALLVVVPMLMVGIISYRESSRTLESEARQYSWQIIEQVKMYIEDYFRDFEISTLKIVNHPDTVAFLKLKTLEEVNDAEIVPAVRDVLKNSAYSQSDVINITLILDGIQTIHSAVQDGVSSVNGIEEEYWYRTMPVTGRPKVYSRIIDWNGRKEPVVSIVKRIANPQTLQAFGMLVIDVNYKRLHDVARKVKLGEAGQGFLFILDEQGYFVYHPNASFIGTMANPDIVRSIGSRASGSFITEADGAKTLLTFSRSETLQWQVVTSIPYGTLMRSREYIGGMIFGTTAAFMAVALVLSFTFAASLARPIRKIYYYMGRVENGDFKGKLPVESTDEIGMLARGFNRMVDRLSELLEEVYFSKMRETEMHLRQKETELRMLQAQINPHFLYNSLDTIRGMALEHDVEDIGSMAAALARLLRYNVKEAGANVTVRQEVEIAQLYLRIQQYRFDERLAFEFDVPPWALQQQICKFTIQPIIENCIVHAMERNLGTTLIRISAALLPDRRFELRISDNGPGIPPETLERLQRRLEDEAEAGDDAHIGMTNVQRRIRHVFGKPCGLRIDSVEGIGTQVGVILPYEAEQGGEG